MTDKNKIEEYVKIAVDALEEKKAIDIRLIDISDISSEADYFIIASGNNKKQVQTLADEVEAKLKKVGVEKIGLEGYQSGNWILQDFKDFVVHIFSAEERLFYDLERIWKDGKEVEI